MNNAWRTMGMVTALLLAGCEHIPSWMGGAVPEIVRLPGERITVLPVDEALRPDAALNAIAVNLPPANTNAEWPQHNGVFTAASGNLSAPGDFTGDSSATAGDGENFTHILVPRPVVGGGKVYAMDAVGNISAHDAMDITSIYWKSEGVAEEDEDDVIGGGLAIDGGRLYATSGRGMVAALDATSGKTLWRKSIGIPFRSAPHVAMGKLFATTLDSQVYAFDTTTGAILWSQRGISETADIMNSVSPTTTADAVIVPYSSGELYALSALDGREIWSDSLGLNKHTAASNLFAGIGGDPVVDGSVVFAVSSAGWLAVLGVPHGQRLWEKPIASINTPWVAGDFLFMLSTENTLVALVKYDGRIKWATQLARYEDEERKLRPISWKGPVMVSGKLALVSSNGYLALVSATDGSIGQTQSIPDDIYTAPVVANGRMYLVSKSATLYSLQ